jgi:hypothetical protein
MEEGKQNTEEVQPENEKSEHTKSKLGDEFFNKNEREKNVRASHRSFRPSSIKNENLNNIVKITSDDKAPYSLIKKIGNG